MQSLIICVQFSQTMLFNSNYRIKVMFWSIPVLLNWLNGNHAPCCLTAADCLLGTGLITITRLARLKHRCDAMLSPSTGDYVMKVKISSHTMMKAHS